ncbi:MAG: hypothetical protein HPY59_06515 [Anaerolineae bacterium]|nr:hypothetical protein [Anaerolineae bacterium]
MYTWRFLGRVVLKAAALFVLFNAAFAAGDLPSVLSQISGYNYIFPGRSRFPFGENQQKAYNLSLNNLNAMFASHEFLDKRNGDSEYRVILLGDSSVWGTLLTPDQTLSGQLNEMRLRYCDGREMRFYNLGYPTLSLTKDVMILAEAMKYKPDMVIWLVTLESFVRQNQVESPLVANNLDRVRELSHRFQLEIDTPLILTESNFIDRTIIGRRRDLADLIRLQLFGVMWAATGIDQEYPETYSPAQRDLESDEGYYDLRPSEISTDGLAFDVISAGFKIVKDLPVVLVNEPMLISNGKNSDIRYNFYYPRWAYDGYRKILDDYSRENYLNYYDAWNLISIDEFTNSAIHLTPKGTAQFAQKLKEILADFSCP